MMRRPPGSTHAVTLFPYPRLFRSFLAAALILVLGACAYMAPYQPPSTYYVMRHLHTPEGAADPGLTEEGQRHARLLADFFTEEPPATIFVSTTKRARQTAAPLAAKLGITPRSEEHTSELQSLMRI